MLPSILNLTVNQLNNVIISNNFESYRSSQIFRSIHQQNLNDFQKINIPLPLKSFLLKTYSITCLQIENISTSSDGTQKYKLKTIDGNYIESIFIPNSSMNGRNTLCLSSQIGCGMGCKFCATASLGLIRNLSTAEIIDQVYVILRYLKETNPCLSIHNLVYMGMGEPLHNYKNVLQSLKTLCSPLGQHYSGRRITVSTSGIVKHIPKLGLESNVNIAISLNAATDDIRNQIMPINKKWNLFSLLKTCKQFPQESSKRLTFEYVLLSNINDSENDALTLSQLLKGIKCKVNLIPFNPHPLSNFQRPFPYKIYQFQKILLRKSIPVFIRNARGLDINAACGTLHLK